MFQKHANRSQRRKRLVFELLETRRVFAIMTTDINPDYSDLDPTTPNGASGGRFNGLASVMGDNQTFYGTSEWGGVYKSTDGGDTWFHLDGHVPQVVEDVEVDPVNTSRVFATSFYDGRVSSIAGIQISRDAGATWENPRSAHVDPGYDNTPQLNFPALGSSTAAMEMSAFGISIRPDNPNQVYVGTNVGLARTRDGGKNWEFIDPSISSINGASDGQLTKVWDVLAQPGGAFGTVDVITNKGHFRSTDGGNTWSVNRLPATAYSATSNTRLSITASPDESYVIYISGNDLNIYESTDGGATVANWRNLGTPDPSPQGRIPFVKTNQRSDSGGNNIFDLWFGDVRLYRGRGTTPASPAVGGPSRMQPVGSFAGDFTTPAGAHNDVGDIVFDTEVSVDASPRVLATDGGVYRNTTSSPDTPTWEQPSVTPHATWLFGMAGVNQPGSTAEDIYFALQDDGFWATQNAGSASPTWTNVESADSFQVVADATQIIYDNGFYSPGRGFRLSIANPGGGGAVQFDEADYPDATPIAASFRYVDSIAQYAPNSYILINGTGIFNTTNLNMASVIGNTVVWNQIGAATSPANPVGVKVAAVGGVPTIFVVAGGSGDSNSSNQLWKFTGTGAGSWTRIDNTGGQTGGIGIFAVDPNNPNRLYASNFSPSGPRMVFSSDGGLTWNPDTELDVMMTTAGVFKYQNSIGPTDFSGFNGYIQPTLLSFDPNNPNNIVAGGHDSGVFLSQDGGANWRLISDPVTPQKSGIAQLTQPRFAHFDDEADPAAPDIYIGTVGRGVWKISTDATLPPDTFEPNDTIGTATKLGSPTTVTLQDLNIQNTTDVDLFRYTAHDTGKLILNLLYDLEGNLDILVKDAAGNIIASGSQSVVEPGVLQDQIIIPVVSQQTYFIEVYSQANQTNQYDLEIENFIAPIPTLVDLAPSSDSGRRIDDNLTNDSTPLLYIHVDLENFLDPDGDGGFFTNLLDPAMFIAGLPGAAVEVSSTSGPIGIATPLGANVFYIDSPLLADGLVAISAAVRINDGARRSGRTDRSVPLLVTIDTIAPSAPSINLDPATTDTGIPSNPGTYSDRVTRVTTPGFLGTAEAGSLVRMYADGAPISNNVINGSDVFSGQTLAVPADYNNNPNIIAGLYRQLLTINLNDGTLGFPTDGFRQIGATSEDLAGNVSVATFFNMMVDTTPARVFEVNLPNGISVFGTKPTIPPSGVVQSLTVTFQGGPLIDTGLGTTAVDTGLASNPAHYQLKGDHSGYILIAGVDIVSASDQFVTVRLNFTEPLPDDRFTLTIDDSISDASGNLLDGESRATSPGSAFILLPSGNGIPGGDFQARFTIDSRPELGTVSQGLVYLDINGNFEWDPTGSDNDATNRDFVAQIGTVTDAHFAGNFAPTGAILSSGYDKLGVYGKFGSTYSFFIDTNDDGVGDLASLMPASYQVNGIPVAGNFNAAHAGDEIGLFDGTYWYLDTNGNNAIDIGERISSNFNGLPIVGDFNGDGADDLATYKNDTNTFFFDLNLDGLVDATLAIGDSVARRFSGLSGFTDRPIAGDMNLDGIDDLGLWVKGRSGVLPADAGEVFFWISDGAAGGSPSTIFQPYSPAPLGNDLYAQFGDENALPVFGNFDPPVNGSISAPNYSNLLHNFSNPLDVNGDSNVTVLDVLLVVNAINNQQVMDWSQSVRVAATFNNYKLDTSGDGGVTALDALILINSLNDNPGLSNRGSGEGEGSLQGTALAANVAAIDNLFEAWGSADVDELKKRKS